MNHRRLSAVTLLKRLKKYEMENEARALGELRLRMVELDSQRQDLVDGIQFQTDTTDVDFTDYMRRFLPAAKKEILSLVEKIAQLEPRAAELEEGVSNKFREFKVFDTIHNSLNEQMRHEEQVREAVEIEEAILWRWAQK